MMNMPPQRQLLAMRGRSWTEQLPLIRAANDAHRQWSVVVKMRRSHRSRSRINNQEVPIMPAPYAVNLPAVLAGTETTHG
jgi:hypothetical protein